MSSLSGLATGISAAGLTFAFQRSASPGDNPPLEKFHRLADDGRRYRVNPLLASLGGHPGGSVVSARDLGPSAQIDRLVGVGHLSPLTDAEAAIHRETAGLPDHMAQDVRAAADAEAATRVETIPADRKAAAAK